MVFSSFFFKELDFKELEIHRYSLLDTINEYQWISINEYQWISINEYGPLSLVPFFGAPMAGLSRPGSLCVSHRSADTTHERIGSKTK